MSRKRIGGKERAHDIKGTRISPTQKGPLFAIARLTATAFHEAIKPGTVGGDGRRAEIITGLGEREVAREGSRGSHAPVLPASTG